jgi:Uma2 family endonuclease
MATIPAVSLEQYLQTSYEQPVEYVDGVLQEKGMTGYSHGAVQGLLFKWFHDHRKQWLISCSLETHTRTSATRVRLPDVVVIRRGTAPKHTIVEAPVLAIEVLSDWDKFSDLKARAKDLETMGTADIWLIDPASRSASVWKANSWIEIIETKLHSSVSDAFVDLEWLWAELDDSQ